jgi:hypothetical protein
MDVGNLMRKTKERLKGGGISKFAQYLSSRR